MDIEKFEKLLKERAEDSLDLKLSDQSWQNFKSVKLKNKGNHRYLLILLSFLFITIISFITGINYAQYQHKKKAENSILSKAFIATTDDNSDLTTHPKTQPILKRELEIIKEEADKYASTKKQTLNTNHLKVVKKNNVSNLKSQTNIFAEINRNSKKTSDDGISEMTIPVEKSMPVANTDILNHNPSALSNKIFQNNVASTSYRNDIDHNVLAPLSNPAFNLLGHHTTFGLKHGIEPMKEKHIPQNYLYFGSLVFIKEHEQNYVGYRLGYYHEIRKNFRLFGSAYKVSDQVELGTQIIPEHFPAPQPGLEIEHIVINKSTYVLPFGLNYTYPKFKIKPFLSLGFAPEYAKINKVKYLYRNSSDNVPEETRNVNIKTSNFYLYSDFGIQGPVFNKFDLKISLHLLNYLSGHEDGAENEDNFKCYLNAGILYRL